MDNANPSAPGAAAAAVVEPPKPRLKAIDRRQMRLHPVEVERLVEADHAVRAIWELVLPWRKCSTISLSACVSFVEGETAFPWAAKRPIS